MTHIQKISDLPKVLGALRELTVERSPIANLWRLGLVLLLPALGYTFYMLFTTGHDSFNTSSDGVIWGISQAVYVSFVLTSTGLTFMASLAMVFGLKEIYPIAKRCIWLAVATLIAGFSVLGLEIGHPFRMAWSMPTGMQVLSPMFWMGTWYAIYMVLLLLKFYQVNRGDWHSLVSRALGVASFVSVVIAHGTLGSLFGMLNMRPLWYDPLLPFYFLATAALSGAAFALFFTHATYGFSSDRMPVDVRERALAQISKVFAAMLGVVIVLIASRTISHLWSNGDGLQIVHETVRTTTFLLEMTIGLTVPFVLMLFERMRRSPIVVVLSSAAVIVGLFVARYEFVVGGQQSPMFKGVAAHTLPAYTPSSMEWAMALVGVSLCLVIYAAGDKLFRLSAAPAVEHAGPQSVSDAAPPASP